CRHRLAHFHRRPLVADEFEKSWSGPGDEQSVSGGGPRREEGRTPLWRRGARGSLYCGSMAIRDDEVVQIRPPEMNRLEGVYLPEVFKGFATTMRHFFTSFG